MSQFRLYWVYEVDSDYGDVVGAEGPLEAARKFVALQKLQQQEEIERGRKHYDELVERGMESEPFERSGFQCTVVLPQALGTVPMKDARDYHDQAVSPDRKYQARAFTNLWDWSRQETVRL